MSQNEAREAVCETLRARGYKVTDMSKGQGVPRLSRLSIVAPGTHSPAICVVKYSTGGRISFAKDETGAFTVLPDTDFVVHVRPVFDGSNRVRIAMFARDVVERAFQENVASLRSKKMEHIPSWVNPDYENGWRLAGSGFLDRAIWTETVSLTGEAVAPDNAVTARTDRANLTIAEAKRRLAETFGVSVDAIDITIRG